jgi:hypothetical protein
MKYVSLYYYAVDIFAFLIRVIGELYWFHLYSVLYELFHWCSKIMYREMSAPKTGNMWRIHKNDLELIGDHLTFKWTYAATGI